VGFRAERFTRHQAEGRNAYVVIGNGGDNKKSICAIPVLFYEYDDKPMEWQCIAWQRFGVPEPSLQVETGGKSLHNYLLLDR
jgi:hypothetical protein